MVNRPKAPCYNEATGTDCPDRKVGCKQTCSKNISYQIKLSLYYTEHARAVDMQNALYENRRNIRRIAERRRKAGK